MPVDSSSTSPSSTQVQRITVSGAVVTEVVTSVAFVPQSSSSTSEPVAHSTAHGLSGGAAAGAAIGAILGVSLILGLLFFCCWRPRRRRNEGDGEKGLNRNTSVLSKAGLLRRASQRQTVSGRSTAPKLQTTGLGGISEDPRSAATMTSATMSTTSNSRGMFVDNRLNPNAWSPTHHANRSTSTLGSLRDYRDYSRPLEVCVLGKVFGAKANTRVFRCETRIRHNLSWNEVGQLYLGSTGDFFFLEILSLVFVSVIPATARRTTRQRVTV